MGNVKILYNITKKIFRSLTCSFFSSHSFTIFTQTYSVSGNEFFGQWRLYCFPKKFVIRNFLSSKSFQKVFRNFSFNQSEKYPENNEMSKKEIDNSHSEGDFNELEKQPTANVCSAKWLFWKCQENFQEDISGSILFLVLLTETLHQGCFLWDFLRYFITPQDGCFWNYLGK